MKKKHYFWIRIIISLVALMGIILHSIFPEIKIDKITVSLLLIAMIPWLNIMFESIEIPGFFKIKYNDDKAKEYIEAIVNIEENERIVEFRKTEIISINSNQKQEYLSLKARVNYNTEAGSTYIMKLHLNNVLIEGWRLKNKPSIKKYIDSRKFNWYHEIQKTWNLQYSPNFESNYNHNKYKVLNGDPYEFVFIISDIDTIDKRYEIKIVHEGLVDRESHKNPIIMRDLKIF